MAGRSNGLARMVRQVAIEMTQQYVVGELSSILGELQTVAIHGPAVGEIGRLRHEVEATPPWALAPLVVRAVALTNRVCGAALARGEAAAFVRQVAICAELRALGVCGGFLEEEPASYGAQRG